MTFSSWVDRWSEQEAERSMVYSQVLLETDPLFHGKLLFGLLSLLWTILIVYGLCAIFSLSSNPLDPAIAGLVGGSLMWFWIVMKGAVKADRLTKERMRQWKEAVETEAHSQNLGGEIS